MKNEQQKVIFAAAVVAATTLLLNAAAPVEEIDLAAGDDSAEERENRPKVEITPDGYLNVMCDNDTIDNVLKQFRRITRQNILCGDTTNLTRRVSASLYNVPWCSALQSILGLANFKMADRDNIWYVSEKTPEEVKRTTRYYVLKHASAVDLANLFNGVAMKTSYEERNSIRALLKAKDGAAEPPTGAEKGADVKSAVAGKARASAFPNTNTLVLTGPEANLIECEKIIDELDRPVTQVYIEARFIELSTEALHKLGVQWDQLKSWGATAKGLKAGYQSATGEAANYGSGLTQKTINNNENANGNVSASETGDSSSANATTSTTSTKSNNDTYNGLFPTAIGEAAGAGASAADMAWRNASTFSGQISADDFSLAISAFEEMQEGKLFSNPRIIVANGKEARVDMTTKEPNVEVKSEYGNQYATTPTVSTELKTIPGSDKNLFAGEAFFSYGITLSVKPRVSSAGLISVEVVPTISEKKGDKKVSGASTDSIYTTYPIINIKSINTEFTMRNGATAVIGGLTQTEEKDVDSGIPYLRKLPWIGQKLFGWQSRQKVQSEILVLVTVGIANPETLRKDAGLPTNAVLGREYVEGRRFEPGERPNALKNIENVDTRTLDAIREDPYELKDDADAFGEDPAPVEAAKPAVAKPAKLVVAEPAKPVVTEPAQPVEETPVETSTSTRCRRRKH